MAVNLLLKACQDGDAYSGLQAFKAALQRKLRLRDEAATHAMFIDAFEQAIVPFRCAEAVSELSVELFSTLREFGHNGDPAGFRLVRAILSCIKSVPEEEASVAWCRAYVQFLVDALGWWRAGRNLQDHTDEIYSLDFVKLLKEELTRAYMLLAKQTEGDGEVSCEALANAYKASLCCASSRDLIMLLVEKVRLELTQTERDFLIARTLYGVLSAHGEAETSPQSALAAANLLLSSEAVPPERAALESFLRDVLLIFNYVATRPALPSGKELGGNVIEALCSAYSSTLLPVSDLDWVALLRAFPTESECAVAGAPTERERE
ncbi:uncharacterized protein Tco025E_07352 [Trypanosoma conorhini]|uniref:Uncharacterized protein n=1 Tax=Trypanosoma conorhini TaxID=83891 RepID=A0A422NPZ4_9TRYP|nr:uncharacterized protein Tco025E_07352 [Trypanosoma conorhini]RNF07535.1 hypothetical protein Tco025E_07352 [Trypanosoma conorhini]